MPYTIKSKKQKTRSSFPPKAATDIFSKFELRSAGSTFQALIKVRGENYNSIFQNPINCAIDELLPNLPLEITNMQYNDMLKSNIKIKI